MIERANGQQGPSGFTELASSVVKLREKKHERLLPFVPALRRIPGLSFHSSR
jgi:hypothetical protein